MNPVLSGPQKAAIVLAQLDTSRATRILKAMSEPEVVQLMSEMATLPALATDEVRRVLGEFNNQATGLMAVGQGGVDVARKLLRERLGSSKAEEIIGQFVQSGHAHPLTFLQRIDPQQMAGFIGDEHPQLIALVLSHLSAESAAKVLACLDPTLRADVARRIATMGRVAPDVVAHVADILEENLAAVLRSGVASGPESGGLSTIVGILNQSDRGSEEQILADLEQSDPDLAEQIRDQMFLFVDVVNLDDRTLQRVLRNVAPKDLALALKNASEEIRTKFLGNLSERAAQDVNDEIDLLGPTRLSQVEGAQSAIVKVVRELEASGDIVLARGDDEFV